MKSKHDPTRTTKSKAGEPNLDPLTGAPGAHPVGTGVGAAAGGATGAAVGAVAGPVGAVVGTIIGAVAGGLAGKGVAEAVDPTAEEAFWRDNHGSQSFANGRDYREYESAYRVGISGFEQGRTFEDREEELRAQYESQVRSPGNRSLEEESIEQLEWEEARHASRAAYDKLANRKAEAARAEPSLATP
jgi:hypothetical protein